jgi:hypothetical protein
MRFHSVAAAAVVALALLQLAAAQQQPPPQQRGPRIPLLGGSKEQKKFTLSSNGFNVEANGAGNAPFYMYWSDDSAESKQVVMFEKLWQTDDTGGGRKLKMVNLMGMYDWIFTEIKNTERNESGIFETAFNMTGIPRLQGNSITPKPTISFQNHLISSKEGTRLKFDVEISGFIDSWWHPDAKSLVMAYRIEGVEGSTMTRRPTPLNGIKRIKNARNNTDIIDLGRSYAFEASNNATGGVKVTASIGTDEKLPYILVSYSKFSMHMRHDPTIYTTNPAQPQQGEVVATYTSDGNEEGNIPPPPPSSPSTTTSAALPCARAMWHFAAVTVLVSLLYTFSG